MAKPNGCMLVLLGLFLCLPFVGISCGRWYKDYAFDRDCGGYMKRAADANSISLALEQMDKVVKYCDANNLTEGKTTIVWDYPSNDIGFWYKNLKESTETLRVESKKPNLTELERSNILMKLRETLVDNSNGGVDVTTPPGISVFPNNWMWCILFWVSGLFAAIGALCIIAILPD